MDILIVGGGYAGVACATRLGRGLRAHGSSARVRLINPAPFLIERIRLHQAATGQPLRERRIDDLLARAGVELVSGWADRIDLQTRTVRVGDELMHWDRLVLAVGSHSGARDVPGAAEHACELEPLSVAPVQARLDALPAGARVTVVGGGLTGIEAASEIAEAFPRLQVQLVSRGALVQDFSEAARRYLHDTLAGTLGIELREDVEVRAVRAGALETDRGALSFDLCIWAAGFRLPALARDAGLRVNARGQVLVDPLLRSISHPTVYAAGDIAAPVLPPGQSLPMGCKSAMPAGAHVGDNLARELRGEPPRAFDYALLFFCVSLGRRTGLIHWADDKGQLTGRIFTGRRGALFKEMICKLTWWALVAEARGLHAVVWKMTGQAPQELPAGQSVAS